MATSLILKPHMASNQNGLSAAELQYQQSAHSFELLCKEEELRKSKLSNMLLAHDLDNLREKLSEETQRGDDAEYSIGELEARFEELNEKFERTSSDLRLRTRELDTLKAELSSLEHVSADSNKLLTEKLALSRELANLRPELEHLRSQSASHESVLTEKLSLQRQLNAARAELLEETRNVERADSKQSRSNEEYAKLQAHIKALEADLVKQKKEYEGAGNTAAKQNATEVEELRKELVKEKREREKAEKQIAKAQGEFNAQKEVLDDKLDQFRTKLRTTKEKLKETEAELQQERDSVASNVVAEPKPGNPRKRTASQMDPDAAIGTPGNAAANKRGKRASSVVGEKSTFSITPFLNRTTSVAPESPAQEQTAEEPGADEPLPSVEDATASPTAHRAPVAKKQALTIASAGKSNPKVRTAAARKKAVPAITLEKVTEEGDDPAAQNDENMTATAAHAAASVADKPPKPMLKPRKSLASFASFREGSLPPQQLQKNKKRKLFGGAKTLFDDDDEDESAETGAGGFGAAKTLLGGKRAFGALGGRGLGGGIGLLGANKKKGPLTVAADGFKFSPLKKERRAMAAAAASEA